jgi:histidinol-phosphate/aromatic aminotransferase/cobyric acid decarboxylase-like protein
LKKNGNRLYYNTREIYLLNVKFVSKIYPTEANFILIKVDDANRRYDELIAKESLFESNNATFVKIA